MGIQQCMSAKLKLPPQPHGGEGDGEKGSSDSVNEEDGESTNVNKEETHNCNNMLRIERGIVVFVCFMKDVTDEMVRKAARTVLNVRLSEEGEVVGGKRKSVTVVGGSVLIIPQATLGGRLKGNSVQYHANIEPSLGRGFYQLFCDEVTQGLGGESDEGYMYGVKCGLYGARQVLAVDTNGPFTHTLDIS